MGATVTIDDELYERALDLAGPTKDHVDLYCEAIMIATFARGHSGKRLAAMGTAGREMSEVPRHLAESVKSRHDQVTSRPADWGADALTRQPGFNKPATPTGRLHLDHCRHLQSKKSLS